MRPTNFNKKKYILLLVIITSLFLGNLISLNIFELNDNIKDKWLLLLILSIILFLIFGFNFEIKKSVIPILILWEFFIFSIFISKYVNGEFVFLEFLLYSLLIPLSFFNPKIIKYKTLFMNASFLSVIPLIYLIQPGNTLGIILCIAGINLLNFLKIKNVSNKYIYLSIITFSIFIFFTNSRTSLIAFLIVAAIYIFTLLKRDVNSYSGFLKKGLTLTVVIFFVLSSYNYITDLLFGKYNRTSSDMLSGRGEMWEEIFRTGITTLGNGESYFLYMYNIGDAHNTYLQVLGAYGLLSFILFILLCFYMFVKSVIMKRIEYIAFLAVYFILGLGENLFVIDSRMIHANIIFIVYLGILMNEKSSKKTREDYGESYLKK